ncbi:MAG: hypothetical protein U0840_07625 [Gemmataceae bacterium]
MAEEKMDGREVTWQRLLPWTLLFRTFQVTLDLNKLLLAAGGIVATFAAWWLLSIIFSVGEKKAPPEWDDNTYQSKFDQNIPRAWKAFREDRGHWNLMNEAAGINREARFELADIAETPEEYDNFAKALKDVSPGPDVVKAYLTEVERRASLGIMKPDEARRARARASQYALLGQYKPSGRLRVDPWSEDRGPNPFLLVTGQAGIPWLESGGFLDWFTRDQFPVMIEPLVKVVRPIIYFLSPRNNFFSSLYFFTVILATVLIWSFVGGAITRIAAVQLTRGERIGLFDALQFTSKRMLAYLTAPLFPLAVVAVILVILGIFGLLAALTYLVGDILISGLLWIVPLFLGLVMAMALVGLVGWPLMAATISTEGTDSWEAVTRAYGYVFQRPWHYLWYSLVSIFYGGLVIFFVGFMGSTTAYLSKWAVNRAPLVQTLRGDNSYLFIYAPQSWGWRELLLEGTVINATPEDVKSSELLQRLNGAEIVTGRLNRTPTPGTIGGYSRWSRIDPEAYNAYLDTLAWWNKLGAGLVAFWLGLAFLLVLAFGYVFFWTASAIMYLLLRKSLESAELDEVYMEEDDYEVSFRQPTPAAAPAPAPAPSPAIQPKAASLPVVEAPPAPPAPVTSAPVVPPAASTPPAASPAPASPKADPKPSDEPLTPPPPDKTPPAV